MPATLPESRPLPTAPTALTEVLVQTIASNAQMLRLLDPERYRQLLETLPSATALTHTPSEENLDDAWDDLERWLVALREQDRAAVEP
jgi:hypothetical protein